MGVIRGCWRCRNGLGKGSKIDKIRVIDRIRLGTILIISLTIIILSRIIQRLLLSYLIRMAKRTPSNRLIFRPVRI